MSVLACGSAHDHETHVRTHDTSATLHTCGGRAESCDPMSTTSFLFFVKTIFRVYTDHSCVYCAPPTLPPTREVCIVRKHGSCENSFRLCERRDRETPHEQACSCKGRVHIARPMRAVRATPGHAIKLRAPHSRLLLYTLSLARRSAEKAVQS